MKKIKTKIKTKAKHISKADILNRIQDIAMVPEPIAEDFPDDWKSWAAWVLVVLSVAVFVIIMVVGILVMFNVL